MIESIQTREPRFSTPELAGQLQALQESCELHELWSAVRGILTIGLEELHSFTFFLDGKERFPGTQTLHHPNSIHDLDWWRRRSRLSPTHAFLDQHPRVPRYSLDEIVPRTDELVRSDFYRHVLVEEGWNKLVGLAFWDRGERRSILCLRRAFNHSEFKPWELALLDELHPHLDVALRRVEKIERLRQQRACLERFLGNFPEGILTLNDRFEVLFGNEKAYDACFLWNHGHPCPRALSSRATFEIPTDFQQAYGRLMEQSMAGGRPGQPFERLHHPTVPDFTATVSLVKDKASLVLAPLLFIHFHPPAELPGGLRVGEPESRMVLLSRLTPREQEVALLAAEGLTNEEVADRLKKSLGTVKNQLQSVFQKLNIHNRARLISVLGSGPVG